MSALKVAIVTGASSGVGRASAIALAAAGWSLALFARRAQSLEETKRLCADPTKVLLVQGDVSNEEDVKRLFQSTITSFGRLDLLFNNAGITSPQVPVEDVSLETFQQVININLVGPFLCTREAVKQFKAQQPPGGRIINNGSISAYTPRPFSAAYTASKHAVLGLTKSTLLDGRAHNITCTQIDIGRPGCRSWDGGERLRSGGMHVRFREGAGFTSGRNGGSWNAAQTDGRERTIDSARRGSMTQRNGGLPLQRSHAGVSYGMGG